MTEKTIFFLHIPKTGGQSLAKRFASSFALDEVHLLDEELHYPSDIEKLARLVNTRRFIESHVAGELLEHRLDLDVMVAVRDPVAQMASNYRHIRREPGNLWHRLVKTLSVEEFFDRFGDDFQDHQSRYLISAFAPLGREIITSGRIAAFHRHLLSAADRVRWLFPTDRIDDFTVLWQLESRHRMSDPEAKINLAPVDDVDLTQILAVIRARPQLYAFDNLLYQIACERFTSYRQRVLDQFLTERSGKAGQCVFQDGEARIILGSGWYAPERTTVQPEWWSGPGHLSTVSCQRSGRTTLEFSVTVVNGISHDEICVLDSSTLQPVALTYETTTGDAKRFRVDMSGLPLDCTILISVPRCYPPIMISPTDNSMQRKAFLAADWQLV